MTSVLFVSQHDADHRILANIFGGCRWQLLSARSCQEACALLGGSDVVLVDARAGWQELLAKIQKSQPHLPLIVVADRDDPALWAEVLNLGGFDLLLKPFDSTEVFRVLSLARRVGRDRITPAVRSAAVA